MLADAPGEIERGEIVGRRRARRRDLALGDVDLGEIAVLHEEAADHALHVAAPPGRPVPRLAGGVEEIDLLVHVEREQPHLRELLRRLEDLERRRRDARRDHDLEKEILHRLGGRAVEDAIDGDDAAEDRHRIGGARLA